MPTGRLEAFSDGVIAIIVTIMVLEFEVPTETTWHALSETWPEFLAYVLSFVNVGMYWNNHHHMLYVTDRINGRILWANLHLLFWLSLIPVTTAWIGRDSDAGERFAAVPVAVYGVVLLAAAIAYYILRTAILTEHGPGSRLARAVGSDLKGKISPVLYALAIALAFVYRTASLVLYALVAAIWLVPDRRIERALESEEPSSG